jgi:two-component system, NarL family, nitrate/nitrite response regulator NarL
MRYRVRSPAAPYDGPTRLIVATDDRIYGDAVLRVIARSGTMVCAAAADAASEAVVLAEAVEADVVLVDATMPGAIELLRWVGATSAQMAPVALRVAEEESLVLELADAGVAGYVSRAASPSDLCAAVDAAARGRLHCSPRIAVMLHLNAAPAARVDGHSGGRIERLSRREHDVLELIARGFSNKEIAATLQIELSTVKHHVHRILEKLEVRRRGQAAAALRGRRMDLSMDAAALKTDQTVNCLTPFAD